MQFKWTRALLADLKKELSRKITRRIVAGFVVVLFILSSLDVAVVLIPHANNKDLSPTPFPLGVDPETKTIVENPAVETFFELPMIAVAETEPQRSWLGNLFHKLFNFAWYQNLATPIGRTLVVEPGERREEVGQDFADILQWNEVEQEQFLSLVASSSPELLEGKFFPEHYLVAKTADPEVVAAQVVNRFNKEVKSRYPADIASLVPLDEALTIASLLQREAYDFEDMRYISGIIWNRLFIDMNLQLDATLQYAKGSLPYGSWWPRVRPVDKYIDSPFNTYKHAGLPPAPIANPSVEAIVAALNPKVTDCLFYFHDSGANFHCSSTYTEHVAKLREIYGQGR